MCRRSRRASAARRGRRLAPRFRLGDAKGLIRRWRRSCGDQVGVPDALQARAIAVRRRSWVSSGKTGRSAARSSRGGSVARTAAKRSGGSEIQRPRRPFSMARRIRQRVFGSSRSPQRKPFSSSSPTRMPVASRTSTERVEARHEAEDGFDLVRRWAASALRAFAWQAHAHPVSRRVVLDAGEVEHLREHRQALADRLALTPGRMQFADELGHVGRREVVDAARSKQGEDAAELDTMPHGRPVGHVDARLTPALSRLGHRPRGWRPNSSTGSAWSTPLARACARPLASSTPASYPRRTVPRSGGRRPSEPSSVADPTPP